MSMPMAGRRAVLNLRWLLWLLAVVLPWQALAPTAFAVRGPAHVHAFAPANERGAATALDPTPAAHVHPTGGVTAWHQPRWFRHAEVHAGSERHHHAVDDPGVVPAATGDGADGLKADEAVSLAAFLALLPAPGAAGPPETGGSAPFTIEPDVATRPAERLERPPRTFQG